MSESMNEWMELKVRFQIETLGGKREEEEGKE